MNSLEEEINSILTRVKKQDTQEQSILNTNEVYVRQSDNTVYIMSCNRIVVPIIL